jgi:hypothetical protein
VTRGVFCPRVLSICGGYLLGEVRVCACCHGDALGRSYVRAHWQLVGRGKEHVHDETRQASRGTRNKARPCALPSCDPQLSPVSESSWSNSCRCCCGWLVSSTSVRTLVTRVCCCFQKCVRSRTREQQRPTDNDVLLTSLMMDADSIEMICTLLLLNYWHQYLAR